MNTKIQLLELLFKYHDDFKHKDYSTLCHMTEEELIHELDKLLLTLYLNKYGEQQKTFQK